jgi:hypothetical protein
MDLFQEFATLTQALEAARLDYAVASGHGGGDLRRPAPLRLVSSLRDLCLRLGRR